MGINLGLGLWPTRILPSFDNPGTLRDRSSLKYGKLCRETKGWMQSITMCTTRSKETKWTGKRKEHGENVREQHSINKNEAKGEQR